MSVPNWRDVFVEAIRTASRPTQEGYAEAIVAAIAAAGYRLHRDHLFRDAYDKCSRCGVEWGTFRRFDSCEAVAKADRQ